MKIIKKDRFDKTLKLDALAFQKLYDLPEELILELAYKTLPELQADERIPESVLEIFVKLEKYIKKHYKPKTAIYFDVFQYAGLFGAATQTERVLLFTHATDGGEVQIRDKTRESESEIEDGLTESTASIKTVRVVPEYGRFIYVPEGADFRFCRAFSRRRVIVAAGFDKIALEG